NQPDTCTGAIPVQNASCTVVIKSATTGTSTVQATSDIQVFNSGGPDTLTRTTNTAVNTAAGGGLHAGKKRVDASIQITPATATNAVGTNHTLTITVNGINGNIDGGSHTATASIVSGPGTFVVGPTCTYTGGGATATCLVVIRATTTGTTVVH